MRAEDGGVLVGGLAIVFLFFWFCVKVGIKPTVGLFYGWTLAAEGSSPAAECAAWRNGG